jgi:hypothetical protein
MKAYLTFFLGIGFLLLMSSCATTGEDPQPQPGSFVRFKVNGVQKQFDLQNNPMGFSFDPNGPVYVATSVILPPGSDGTKNFLNLALRNETLFQTDLIYQMQDPIRYQGAEMVRIQLTYANEDGQLFNAVLFQQTIPGMKVTDDAWWKFTRITSSWVEGEFGGVLLGPISQLTGRGDTELLLTEGQFSLPLISSIP